MEDTPDKIRRNVVVFSAAIVIGWFLELKLTDVTKLFWSADFSHVSLANLWIVVFAVLAYLILRYRFDESTNSQLVSLSDDLNSKKKQYVYEYLRRHINKINRSGKIPSIFGTSLLVQVSRNKKEYEIEHKQSFSWQLYAHSPWHDHNELPIEHSDDIYHGRISISEKYFGEGIHRREITSSGSTHDFSVPLSGRAWVETHAFTHIASYSKSAVDLLTPIALAYAALLITINALAITYLN